MIGRDKIVVNVRRDGVTESLTVYGTVVTEQVDGKLEALGNSLVFSNFYRLILPHTLDLSGVSVVSVDFGTKVGARLETPLVRVYDGRGRVHHYEGVVRSS